MVFFLFFLRHILASIESSQCIQCIQWPQFLGSVPSNSRTKMTLAEWDCSLQQHHWWKIHPTARVHCFLVIHALPQKNLAEINSTHSSNFSSSQSWKWNMGLWKMSLSLQKVPCFLHFPRKPGLLVFQEFSLPNMFVRSTPPPRQQDCHKEYYIIFRKSPT